MGQPLVAVIDPDRDLGVALREVVTLARCQPLSMSDVDELNQCVSPPAAIIIRLTKTAPRTDPIRAALRAAARSDSTKVLALASDDEDVAEAHRLGADVVLREPHQIRGLYDVLTGINDSMTARDNTPGGQSR
jgi:hypothetical protein